MTPDPVTELSAYGYRVGGQPLSAYVPLSADEPGATPLANGWDEPGEAAYAGSGQPVGPELWRRVVEMADTPEGRVALRQIIRSDSAEPREFVYEGVVGFQSAVGTGNAIARIFDVPQGARAYLTRALVEVGGQAPGSAASAAAWVGIYETGGGDQTLNTTTATYQPGQLRHFAPRDAAGGLFLPCLLTDQDDAAWGFRSGMGVVAVLAGIAGLAAKAATIAYRFNLRFDQAAV